MLLVPGDAALFAFTRRIVFVRLHLTVECRGLRKVGAEQVEMRRLRERVLRSLHEIAQISAVVAGRSACVIVASGAYGSSASLIA